jgi:hypothetical protein
VTEVAHRSSARILILDGGDRVLLIQFDDPRTTDLGRPVAVSRGAWAFRGQSFYSEDWFLAWRVAAFEPDDAGWTDLEREVHRGWRWWTSADLDRTDEVVFPAGLGELVRAVQGGAVPPEPVVLPWTTF